MARFRLRRRAQSSDRGERLGDPDGALQLLFAANPLPMWVYDLETLRFVEVNDAAIAQYGYTRDSFLSMLITDIFPTAECPHGRRAVSERKEALWKSGTWRHRRADGSFFDVEINSQLLVWAGRPAALVVAHDVTETRRLQAELTRQALFDEATGFASVALFADRVRAALAGWRHEDRQVGVIAIGLGALDIVASTAGDEAADAMVKATADRLRACCGAQETLARLGGGRFAILREARDEHAILALAGTILRALGEPVEVSGWGHLGCNAAVGVALASREAMNAASLVRDAGSAMRHAAERGGREFIVFNAELRRRALDDFETEQALGAAARLGQLHLCHQPVVDLAGGGVIACEALLRWERPGLGLVGPERFIPLAERSGLIVELGAWVIEHAIAEAAAWRERARVQPKVGINLSAHQLRDVDLVERFSSACAESGLQPSFVCVELTESALVANDDYSAYKILTALREMGIEVAIDDFGTGYSALSYLDHLPIDVVKIDRGFVAGLGVGQVDRLLVDAVIKVAHALDLRVVAEGVETELQLNALRELGCDAAQGYLLARPTIDAELPTALRQACEAVAY